MTEGPKESNMESSKKSNSQATYSYGPPTQEGMIQFEPPGLEGRKCETAFWLWGDLGSKTPPLIVLHGGPGAPGRDWKVITSLYEKHGIPVLLYDQIGCGASTHLRDLRGDGKFWTIELFIAELENVIRHFHIKTFDLLGHSCGGEIAVTFALTQPKGLRKLILSSSAPSDALRLQAQLRQRTALPQDLLDTMLACEKEGRLDSPEYGGAVQELMQRHLCRLNPWPPEIQETMALMGEDDTVQFSAFGPEPLNPTGPWKDYDVVSRLPEITEETVSGGVLLTNGRYDMDDDEVMAPFFTHIRARVKWVRFAESSHMAHLEEPQPFLEALAEFLAMA